MTQMFPNIHIKCFFSWYMESFQMVTWTSSQDNLAFPSWIIFCGNSGVWLWWWFPCRLSKCQTPLLTTILFIITLSPDNQATWSNETCICRWEMSPVSVDNRCVEINIHTLYSSLQFYRVIYVFLNKFLYIFRTVDDKCFVIDINTLHSSLLFYDYLVESLAQRTTSLSFTLSCVTLSNLSCYLPTYLPRGK